MNRTTWLSEAMGNLLMRFTALRKSWFQNLRRRETWARSVNPISTMCLCFRSTLPFWWCVRGLLDSNMPPCVQDVGKCHSLDVFCEAYYDLLVSSFHEVLRGLWFSIMIFLLLSSLASTKSFAKGSQGLYSKTPPSNFIEVFFCWDL